MMGRKNLPRYSGRLGDGLASVYEPRAFRRRTLHPLTALVIGLAFMLFLWKGLPLLMVITKALGGAL